MLKFPTNLLKIAETTIQHTLIYMYLLTGEITHVYGMITRYFASWEYGSMFSGL